MTQAAGKTYLPFVAGLEDAWRTRIITHASGDWAADQFWMTAYYSVYCGRAEIFSSEKSDTAVAAPRTIHVVATAPLRPASRTTSARNNASASQVGAWSGLLLMRAPRPAAAPGYAELAAGKEGLV